jgi:hypothetical protein
LDDIFENNQKAVEDRQCGVLVRGPGFKGRGSGFDFRRYHIFCIAVGLKRGPVSLVRIIEELPEGISSGSGIEN